MSIHPLTRLIPGKDAKPAAIEAYVELFDSWGDGVKGLGTILFELYRGEGAAAEQLARWSEDLSDPDANSKRYDRVTRAYRFRLNLAAGSIGGERTARYELRARFTPATGGAGVSAGRVLAP